MMKLRRIGGYGAAIAVTPYLLIKIAWTFGLLLPTDEMGDTSWRAINATTAILAAVGILLAMTFVRPWGGRLPAWLVALPVWIGTGLLVPMLLLAPVLGPAAMARDQEAGAADVWVYEQFLVMVSLVGVGIGLPLALAGYVKARWPEALSGPIDSGDLPGNTHQLQTTLARFAAIAGIVLGATRVYWAAGGTLGLDPATLDHRDLWWHALSLSTGAWAFVGVWGMLSITERRSWGRFLLPMAATWISSGMLFSYSLYSLLSATRPGAPPVPEYPLAHLLTTQSGVVLGLLMGMTILLVLHDRRRVLHRRHDTIA